mmetsp:Transcript_108153/g.150912  ORF Transcript_108153/g.150912 Transcript_108153/m.150912 type:complete len:383 (-) Transcript_108153:166-1314(-)
MAPTRIQVFYVEGSELMDITSKMTGQDLLEKMCSVLNMPPITLFSFAYRDKKDFEAFLKLDKKIMAQDLNKKQTPITLDFKAKFFPESVNDELTDAVVQRLFWKQIKNGVVNNDIYCPPELCVLFAAQSMQADHGDYDASKHGPGTVIVANQLPQRVIDQHGLTVEQWEDRVTNAWIGQQGIAPATAIMDYLNIAQDLEQYGITYFEITNKKGTRLWLGVHNLGMDIYEYNNKVTPRLGFPWGEIRNISFNDKKFTIKMVSKEAPDFKFFSPRFKVNKRILALCVGNHFFFISRRRAQANGELIQEDRATLEAKLRKTKEQLLAIRMDLEKVKDASKVTREDQEHEKREAEGMDKFKTMKKAQAGDAKRRIMDFENLEEAEC